MPKVTLYVRDDDMEAFEAIQNKPEWLHRAIAGNKSIQLPSGQAIATPAPKPLEQFADGSHGITIKRKDDSPHYEPIDDMP